MSSLQTYEQIKQALASGTPAALLTVVSGPGMGARLLQIADEQQGTLGDAWLDREALALVPRLMEEERSETVNLKTSFGDDAEVFIETFPPPPLLLIFGAVHAAQPLSRFAKDLGFRVVVTDARAKLATAERFPDVDQIIQAWPEEALEQVEITPNTYVAILSHDPKFDEPALIGTLETPARYIGAVGSRKTNRDRRDRLLEAGASEESIARIRGPIGLDIGAQSPEEMAIAILAEIIAVRHGRTGGPLTQATGAIRGRQDVAAN